MNQAIAPWRMPAAEFAGSGGVTGQAFGKPGEIRRRKATGLRREPDQPSGRVMFAGLRAKQGKPCDAKAWGLNCRWRNQGIRSLL